MGDSSLSTKETIFTTEETIPTLSNEKMEEISSSVKEAVITIEESIPILSSEKMAEISPSVKGTALTMEETIPTLSSEKMEEISSSVKETVFTIEETTQTSKTDVTRNENITPKSKDNTPKSTESTPKSKENISKSKECTPNTPKSKGNAPTSKENTSISTRNTPISNESIMKSNENTPRSKENNLRDNPRSKENSPKPKNRTIRNTPKSIKNSPNSEECTPKSKGNTPKIEVNTSNLKDNSSKSEEAKKSLSKLESVDQKLFESKPTSIKSSPNNEKSTITTKTTRTDPSIPLIECGEVKWTIRNFLYFKLNSERCISPSFSVGNNSPFSWSLAIDPKLWDTNETVKLFLARRDNEASRTVKVTFKYGFQCGEEMTWCSIEHNFSFEMHQIQMTIEPDLIDCCMHCLCNDFIIYCKLIIFDYDAGSSIKNLGDEYENLKILSHDIHSIFGNDQISPFDAFIKADDGKIGVHKNILLLRSKFFFQKLSETKKTYSKQIIHAPGLSLKELRKILAFVYSGDIGVLMKDYISTDLFDRVYDWYIYDLMDLLEPVEISVCTDTQDERFEYKWEIENFNQLMTSELKIIPSAKLKLDIQRCHPLELQLSEIDDDFIVELKNPKLELPDLRVLNYLSVLDVNGKRCFEFINSFSLAERYLGGILFSRKELLENKEIYLPKNTLTINCIVSLIMPNSKQSVLEEKWMDSKIISAFDAVNGLSVDLGNLLIDNPLSDLTIETGKKKYKVNKVILANRPSQFQDTVQNMEPWIHLLKTKLPPNEVEKILLKIYTGSELSKNIF